MASSREKKEKKDPTAGEVVLGLGLAALAGYGAVKLGQWLMSGSKDNNSDERESDIPSASANSWDDTGDHVGSFYGANSWDDTVDDEGSFYGADMWEDTGASVGSYYGRETAWSRSNIGVNFNDWRKPTSEFSDYERGMEHQLKLTFGKFNLGKKEWTRARDIVNTVLDMLFTEIKKEAEKFEGLKIERFIKQGSSREGLKVGDADEFDTLLKYHIEGLNFNARAIGSGDGGELPELIHLLISVPPHKLQSRYKRLYDHGVFTLVNGVTHLNARILHERVFTSIIDKAKGTICGKVNLPENDGKFDFKINRRQNAPSINIIIELREEDQFDGVNVLKQLRDTVYESAFVGESSVQTTTIDVDIVPGLLLQNDLVPDPTQSGQTMMCPRYAVCKWVTDNHRSASRYPSPELVWRNCSSGYEKHVLDVAQYHTEQRYIITAVRIAKMYFRWQKKNYLSMHGQPPPQISSVLRSYHLKHLGFYCILYLTILNRVRLTGVRQALAYLLEFLQVCLEEEHLPHFFQGNENLVTMFPHQEVSDGALRYDLFTNKRGEALLQARRSMKLDMRKTLSNFYDEDAVDRFVVQQFREYVRCGDYCV